MEIELLKINSLKQSIAHIKSTKADEASIDIMDKKSVILSFKIYNCAFYNANILKQEALSLGIDVSISKDVIIGRSKLTDCFLFGDVKRLLILSDKLKLQSFVFLRELGKYLSEYLYNYLNSDYVFRCRDKIFDLKNRFLIMGILNVTPDSFFDGGKYNNMDKALKRVESMLKEHADIIDIGGESTRPGSERVSLDEEFKRVIPVIENIKKYFNCTISVDTYKSEVAKEAIEAGVDIVNDISGLQFDRNMLVRLSKSNVGIIIMHIKGEPRSMQVNPAYKHVIYEINSFFNNTLNNIQKNNINRKRVILDPGIGFGKKHEHNLKIINNIDSFKVFGRPILIGTSRKSFIGYLLDKNNPKDRLSGSIASHLVALMKGASIFRVHDVKETYEALIVAKSIIDEEKFS